MQTGFCLCKQGQVIWGTEFRSHIIQAFVPSEFVLDRFIWTKKHHQKSNMFSNQNESCFSSPWVMLYSCGEANTKLLGLLCSTNVWREPGPQFLMTNSQKDAEVPSPAWDPHETAGTGPWLLGTSLVPHHGLLGWAPADQAVCSLRGVASLWHVQACSLNQQKEPPYTSFL